MTFASLSVTIGADTDGIHNPQNTDNNGNPDYLDIDSDNDGQPDVSDDDCGDLPLFDLALDKDVVSAGPYQQGSIVTYTVAVTNEGEIDAADVAAE